MLLTEDISFKKIIYINKIIYLVNILVINRVFKRDFKSHA